MNYAIFQNSFFAGHLRSTASEVFGVQVFFINYVLYAMCTVKYCDSLAIERYFHSLNWFPIEWIILINDC